MVLVTWLVLFGCGMLLGGTLLIASRRRGRDLPEERPRRPSRAFRAGRWVRDHLRK